MSIRYLAALLLSTCAWAPMQAQEAPLLRVFISSKQSPTRTGHKAQRMVDDLWAELVKRGAATSAGLIFPTTLQIHNSDVLVMYGDKVLDVRDSQRADLEVFLQRGGGLVVLHNTVEQPKAALFAPRLGMIWKPDQCRWKGGVARILDLDPDHPVTRGLKPFMLAEELGQGIELAPGAHVLAKGAFRGEPATPQIWAVETNGQRTVVILPGHNYATFEQPEFRVLFCRAIAWAAKFDPDTLLLPEERVRYGASTPPAPPAPNPPAMANRKEPQAGGGTE